MKSIDKYVIEKLVITKDVDLQKSKEEQIKLIKDTIKDVIVNQFHYTNQNYKLHLCDASNYITDDEKRVDHISIYFKELLKKEKEIVKQIMRVIRKKLPKSIVSKIENTSWQVGQGFKYVIYL